MQIVEKFSLKLAVKNKDLCLSLCTPLCFFFCISFFSKH